MQKQFQRDQLGQRIVSLIQDSTKFTARFTYISLTRLIYRQRSLLFSILTLLSSVENTFISLFLSFSRDMALLWVFLLHLCTGFITILLANCRGRVFVTAATLLAVNSSVANSTAAKSCSNLCGTYRLQYSEDTCQCDAACEAAGDCCPDFGVACPDIFKKPDARKTECRLYKETSLIGIQVQ